MKFDPRVVDFKRPLRQSEAGIFLESFGQKFRFSTTKANPAKAGDAKPRTYSRNARVAEPPNGDQTPNPWLISPVERSTNLKEVSDEKNFRSFCTNFYRGSRGALVLVQRNSLRQRTTANPT